MAEATITLTTTRTDLEDERTAIRWRNCVRGATVTVPLAPREICGAPIEYGPVVRFEEVGVVGEGELHVTVAPLRRAVLGRFEPLGLET